MFKVCAYVLGVVASPIRQGSSCSGGCLPEKIVFVPTNSPLEAACPHEKHHTSLRASVWMTGCAPTGMRIWSFGFGVCVCPQAGRDGFEISLCSENRFSKKIVQFEIVSGWEHTIVIVTMTITMAAGKGG